MRDNASVKEVLSFAPDPGRVPLGEAKLLVVVGLTGVGKTSFTQALGWPLLPNRRQLVDDYVLPAMGMGPDGLDRAERFEMTRRWRKEHPGGLAEVLAAAYVRPVWPLVFDGLRGEAEVAYAYQHLPKAHFVVLEAPVSVRLERLLGRRDGFDRVDGVGEGRLQEAARGVLSEEELARLAAAYPAKQLIEKLSIVAAEQRNYHPDGPRRVLAGSPRALFIDTVAASPEQAAERVREWLGANR